MKDPTLLEGIQQEAETDLRWELQMALLRSLLTAVVGAALLSALVLRRVRVAVVAVSTASAAMVASFGVALATWNPNALAEPGCTGR